MRASSIQLIMLLLLPTMVVGCSTAAPRSVDRWVARNGGLINSESQQTRVDAIARRLTTGQASLAINVHVLNTDAVGAYAWPDRSIYVTRGLLERTTEDDLLAAAMAHEMGHLLTDGLAPSPASVKGHAQNLDAECQADAYAVELLRTQGIPATAMPRLLRLVRDAGKLSQSGAQSMDRRIDLLTGR